MSSESSSVRINGFAKRVCVALGASILLYLLGFVVLVLDYHSGHRLLVGLPNSIINVIFVLYAHSMELWIGLVG